MSYSLLTKILAPAGILLIIPIVYRFLRTSCKSSGRPVSAAYKVWLAYLLYVYLILTPVLAFDKNIPSANLTSIRFFAILIYARVVLQYVLSFRINKWTPLIGFSYNLFCLFQFSYLYTTYSDAFFSEAFPYHSSSLFLQILISCLLVDSFYTLTMYRNRRLDTKLTIALNVLFCLALLLLLGSFYV